jgi:glyoxylase-like metal-dependent hydrolase (beta-lactamase superfamily II)
MKTNLMLGDIRVDRLVEMVLPFDKIQNFFPDASQQQIDTCKPWMEPWALCPITGKIILVVQSYLIRTRHHTILIDTCVGCDKTIPFYAGWNKRTDRSWLDKFTDFGLSPADVDFVLCTHLHCDHVGWNTQLLNGQWQPTFPNAKYIMSRKDFELAQQMDQPGYRENVLPIVLAGQTLVVDSDYLINENIWLEPTPGHTPGHVAIGLLSKGHEAVMCGDLMHSPIQCAYPEWSAFSDDDPVQAEVTRRKFLFDSCKRNRLVMTAHFPEPSIGRIVESDQAYRYITAA